jgi:hypothetical protein
MLNIKEDAVWNIRTIPYSTTKHESKRDSIRERDSESDDEEEN